MYLVCAARALFGRFDDECPLARLWEATAKFGAIREMFSFYCKDCILVVDACGLNLLDEFPSALSALLLVVVAVMLSSFNRRLSQRVVS